MIASAVATIPFADLEPRLVDPKILDTYLGVWTAAPTSPAVTLTREGGKLFAQESNETEKVEFLAVSDSTFVIRGDSALITFEKGPDGKETRMLFRGGGGSVRVFERSIVGRKHQEPCRTVPGCIVGNPYITLIMMAERSRLFQKATNLAGMNPSLKQDD